MCKGLAQLCNHSLSSMAAKHTRSVVLEIVAPAALSRTSTRACTPVAYAARPLFPCAACDFSQGMEEDDCAVADQCIAVTGIGASAHMQARQGGNHRPRPHCRGSSPLKLSMTRKTTLFLPLTSFCKGCLNTRGHHSHCFAQHISPLHAVF